MPKYNLTKLKIIAIIPARGGSKRIPKKNIKNMAGKPLVAWTIESALKSRLLDRVIVSTDDKEIAQISKKYKAEIIERPKELATDKAKAIDALWHVLECLKKENYVPDAVIFLQPTSPLRTDKDILKAIDIFLKNKCESVVSVSEMNPSPYWSFKIEDKYLKLLFGEGYLSKRSQDLPKIYVPNGAIFIAKIKTLENFNSFYTSLISPYIMPQERSIDIDTKEDFKKAENFLRKYNGNKNKK
jgi:CMP-N-acetylneuraminic acid synthetase